MLLACRQVLAPHRVVGPYVLSSKRVLALHRVKATLNSSGRAFLPFEQVQQSNTSAQLLPASPSGWMLERNKVTPNPCALISISSTNVSRGSSNTYSFVSNNRDRSSSRGPNSRGKSTSTSSSNSISRNVSSSNASNRSSSNSRDERRMPCSSCPH